MPGFADAVQAGPIVLDGGLATELERQGADLSSALWSARLLLDDPAAILAAHREFFDAGAQVAISASYQVSLTGFADLGVDGAAMLRRSVELAREATDGVANRWVAASIGPYGAVLADGSEYRGDYRVSVAELRRFHRPRIMGLAASEPDVLAVETIPCLAEVEAVLAELEDIDTPAWLALSCAGVRTRAGEPAVEAFAMARDCDALIAVGVNCVDPADALALVRSARSASHKPVVVYPNSGETWDAGRRRWIGETAFNPADVHAWIDAGARLVGGCCRVAPSDIRRLRASVPPAIEPVRQP